MKRVVITGMGAITPIGKSVDEFWKGIEEGKCGIDQITKFDVSNYKVKLAGEVKDFNPEDYMDRRNARRLDRYCQLAMAAAKEVMEDSKLDVSKIDSTRFGVIVGSGIGGLDTTVDVAILAHEKGPDRVPPLAIPMIITNMASGNISIEYGAKGESYDISVACSTGTHCIGEAYRLIKHGYQDVVMAGGTESAINSVGIAGFTNIKALSQSTDKNRASIPFDKERNGFVMGEGAGILMLEELEHAKKRGAKIYAEVVGFGSTSDSYHITAPDPEGNGIVRAMNLAIQEAGIKPEDVEYINAHGTSTHLNDAGETKAVKKALGEASKKVLMSSIKGNVGHLLGAAGAVEAIATVKAIETGIIPPTINYKVPDEECDLDIVPNTPRHKDITYAMSNSLAFGGQNGSLIFKKFEN